MSKFNLQGIIDTDNTEKLNYNSAHMRNVNLKEVRHVPRQV